MALEVKNQKKFHYNTGNGAVSSDVWSVVSSRFKQ